MTAEAKMKERTNAYAGWRSFMIMKLQPKKLVTPLFDEANEILSIIVSSIKTSRGHHA